MSVPLRDYQSATVDAARAAIRAGARSVLICAPTGAGKTQIASHLIEECRNKGRRANFVVDRLSLLNQTSEVFDGHGIDHGVIQAEHYRFAPSKPVQVCSIQTVTRRRWPESDMDVIDEAHVLHQAVKARVAERGRITLGLTATPFTKGLGKHFDAIINVTTTNKLIEQRWLSPYRVFSCVEPDMSGVRVTSLGEWDEKEASSKALEVVGDVVAEYTKHGEGRKFICSAVDTAHVAELQHQFIAAGINAASYTFKDADEDRADTVNEFRKPDSTIRGLITVTAASRGFDVPDVSCIIMARPLRKSLAEHIQLFGRGLRIAEGKSDCIVLCHSGNMARFWQDMQDFFEVGVTELDDGKKKPKEKPKNKPDAEPVKCPQCRHMHLPRPSCPNCGHEYPRKAAVQHVAGTLTELIASGNRKALTDQVWPQVCGYARRNRHNDDAARKMALALYKRMTGGWPTVDFHATPSARVTSQVKKQIAALNEAYRASITPPQAAAQPESRAAA